MTPEQEVRAAALLAAATITGPQLGEVVNDPEFDYQGFVEDFRLSVESYADYIQHGHWPIPVPDE